MTTSAPQPPPGGAGPDLGFPPGASVLFQGDSITDGGRLHGTTDPNHLYGHSYPFLIVAQAGAGRPERGWTFANRGVSGDTVADLAARWQSDTLDLAPDVLSVLIGANDARAVALGESADADGAVFRAGYDALLRRTRAALPGVRLVLGEPFTLPTGEDPDFNAAFATTIGRFAAHVADLASAHGAVFVPYGAAFAAALRRAPAHHWIWDAIHPTAAGHAVLAAAWQSSVTPT